MVFAKRNRPSLLEGRWLPSSAAIIAVGLSVAACSADFSRFGGNGLGYKTTDSDAQTQPIHSDGSLLDQRSDVSSSNSKPSYNQRYGSGVPSTTGSVKSSRLADAAPAANEQRYEPAQYRPEASGEANGNSGAPRAGYRQANVTTPNQVTFGREQAPSAQPARDSQVQDQDSSITVQRGDTLYNLARRHRVTVEQLKQANGLSGNVIKPGQVLVLNGTSRSAQPGSVQSRNRRVTERRAAPGGDTYTVQSGDSLYAISRQTGVRVAELQDLNNITDVRRIRPGTVLRLNRGAASDAPRERQPIDPPRSTSERNEFVPRTVKTTTQPIIINSKQTRAAAPTSTGSQYNNRIDDPTTRREAPAVRKQARLAPRATNSSSGAGQKYRWPVSGRIIGRFGKQSNGKKNDGINIAVPVGTDIHAAEAGVVAYAGNELKGYGNLILIRHDNGYVTAYAHSNRMLVRRGDAVSRGQVIAKAGKTGSVSRPQVHFELRDGAKPVDPMPHLGRL